MKTRLARGFSLVELLAGLVAASVLVLTVATILVYGYTAGVRNNRAVNMQRDASLAMQMLGKDLREASTGRIDVSVAGRLSISSVTGTATAAFYQQGNTLLYNPDVTHGGVPFPVVQGWMAPSGLACSNIQGGVGVALLLQDGSDTMVIRGSFHCRN